VVKIFSYYAKTVNRFIKEGFTEGEAKYIANKIANAIRSTKDTCISHMRVSVDGKDEEKYQEMRSSGCCAFYDDEVQLRNGRVVKFGFNYGH
jgi:hypothetical protein